MLQRFTVFFVLAGCFQIFIAYLLLSHVWSRIRQMKETTDGGTRVKVKKKSFYQYPCEYHRTDYLEVHLGYQYPGRPAECLYPPKVSRPEECCELDPFYSIEELDSCAATVANNSADCDVLLCLMRLRDYVNENNDLLLDKISKGLDEWASGTLFQQKLPAIKEYCMKALSPAGPPRSCEQARLFQCMGSLWTNNCPEEKWMKTENCATFKKHLQLCGPPPL